MLEQNINEAGLSLVQYRPGAVHTYTSEGGWSSAGHFLPPVKGLPSSIVSTKIPAASVFQERNANHSTVLLTLLEEFLEDAQVINPKVPGHALYAVN